MCNPGVTNVERNGRVSPRDGYPCFECMLTHRCYASVEKCHGDGIYTGGAVVMRKGFLTRDWVIPVPVFSLSTDCMSYVGDVKLSGVLVIASLVSHCFVYEKRFFQAVSAYYW